MYKVRVAEKCVLGIAVLVWALSETALAAPQIWTYGGAPAYTGQWGSYGEENGQFFAPIDAALDASGNVYVTDSQHGRIEKFDANGSYLTQIGGCSAPYGVALDASGNVYVADLQASLVKKFDGSGNFITQWGSKGSAEGQFNFPNGVAVDRDNYVYVVDSNNHRVQKFTADGAFVTQWGGYGSENGQFLNPIGIAVAASGSVYVTDAFRNRVQKFTTDGVYVAQWGSQGSGPGQFSNPTAICVDASGSVYVADAINNRIQKFDPNGAYLTQWGSAGSGDGQFSSPDGLALSPSGTVYVVDTGNNRVEKFTAPVQDAGASLSVTMSEDGAPVGWAAPALYATDAEGSTLTWSLSSLAFHGVATVSGTGVAPAIVAYTPNPGWNGADSFTVQVSDGAATDTVIINVTVEPVNDPPVIDQGAGPLEVTMSEDGAPVAWSAPALSATDAEGDTLTWSVSNPAFNGVATVSGTGASPAEFTYAPYPNWSGMDSFVVQVDDGNGGVGAITINVTVEAVNDPPVIDQGSGPLSVAMSQNGAPLAWSAPALSATDAEGDTLTWSVSSPASNGVATVSGTGATPAEFTYAPNPNWSGMDSFIVQVDDGNGGVSTITVNVTVEHVNAVPVIDQGAGPFAVTMSEDGAPVAWVAPTLSATDADGDTLTWSVSGSASNGVATVSGTGAAPAVFTYTPNPNWNGGDVFEVQVADGNGGAATATINVTVEPVNDAPIIILPGNAGNVVAYETQWGGYGAGNGQFNWPGSLAVDSLDNVYVVDYGNNRVQKFTADGVYVTQWGSEGTGDSQFHGPVDIAVNASGNVYVVDYLNNRIQKFTADGVFITQWGAEGTGDSQFEDPGAITADASGNVYVVDNGNNRIQKFTADGVYITQWGSEGSGDGQFEHPWDLATDASGNVYVADSDNNRIQKFDANGVYLAQWGSGGSDNGFFDDPEGITLDASGNVYVADSGNNRIQKFTADGVYITQWGNEGSSNGQFSYPSNVAVDRYGRLYVADAENNRIQRFIQGQDVGASVSVTMSENGAPLAWMAPDLYAVDPDTGDTLTWSLFSQANYGAAAISGTGVTPSAFTYAPNPNWNGADSFIIKVDDGNGGADTVTVNVTVAAVAEGEGEGEGETPSPWHTADQNHDNLINLSELLRVIQFFNSHGLHCQAGTEDGYAPGPGDDACTPHDSDYNPQDWQINLSELLRVIQFFNSHGYHACPAMNPPTEDGFCVGPAK